MIDTSLVSSITVSMITLTVLRVFASPPPETGSANSRGEGRIAARGFCGVRRDRWRPIRALATAVRSARIMLLGRGVEQGGVGIDVPVNKQIELIVRPVTRRGRELGQSDA